MTTLTCDLCDYEAQGETFEAWMKDLMPHYMEAHADFMMDPSHTEEGKEEWMTKNKARFEAA